MENNITLSLGGEERTLVFGKISFLKHIGLLTKESGFNILDADIFGNPSKSYQSVLCFVHAGLICGNYKITAEEVEKWVDELGIEEIADIQYAGFAALTGKTVEELKNSIAQTVQKNGLSMVPNN